MTKRTKRKKRNMTLYIICIIAICIIALWNQPITRNYEITTSKIKGSFTIAHLSDLHSSTYGKNQLRLIKKIDLAKPDLVFLTGDIVDDIVSEEGAYILLEDLVTKYPLYYVDGNHEVWHYDTAKIYQQLEAIGVHILYNSTEVIEVNGEEILLAGIMDSANQRYKAKDKDVVAKLDHTKLNELQSDLYTILLAHRPEFVELYSNYPLDLVLSGHAHGGQVRIPFILNGLFAPDQGYFPKYAGGLYHLSNYDFIISRGLSFNLRLPRVFNPPEVVIIQVNGGEHEY